MHGYSLMLQELHARYGTVIFVYSSPLSQNVNNTIMKSAQAASEIKPTLQQVYINKLNRKLKSMGKATSLKKKPWWIYSAGWKNLAQRLKMPQKMLQQQENSLKKQIMSSIFPPINNQNKNVNLSPDMEIIKITTVIEAIRQKRQKMSEATKNIRKIIGKKRSKRSSYESGNNSTVTTDSRHARQRKTFVPSRRSRYPTLHRKQQTETFPTKKNAVDPKTANNVAIPSTVFYKRIWEYINGTRPHSDIISDYGTLENNSEKNNSTCTDKDRLTTSQSQEDKSQVTSPDIKPEQDFYKHIWDIINSANQTYENAKVRSKRNASIPKNNATSTQLCVQGKAANYEENKQVQATNEKTSLDIADPIDSAEISDSGPYISSFWTVANKTQWQPKTIIPVAKVGKLNNDLILSSFANTASASEVDDLNKLPDKVESVGYSSSDNSTGHTNEARNLSQEIIAEPGPPYSSEESSATSSFSPTERAVDKASQEEDRAEHAENYSTGTSPDYDPSNIPYVEIPDYSDQQEDSLDKSNQSATAREYKEYDNSDYGYSPKQLYDADDFSSKSPSAEIKVVQTESDEPETALNANNSRSRCTKNKDSAECTDNYDVEDTKLRNNTEGDTDNDVHRSAEESAELTLSEERENSDFVDFDINEYRKPFNWNEFFKNDPIFKNIRATASKENTEYDHKENPDRTEESEEVETYATDPKKQSHDYFAKNEDDHDDHGIASRDDKDVTKEETDSYAKKEAKESEEIDEDHYPYDDKDFIKHIFEKDSDKKSSDTVDTEKEFLSRYFTEDVLRQLRDNSTAEEDRQKEESRNREDIHKTLSKILDKKDRFSRLDENLNKMVEKGEARPIRYNNFWSLEYESPHKKSKAEEETEDSTEEEEA